jgi:hypothetical protein
VAGRAIDADRVFWPHQDRPWRPPRARLLRLAVALGALLLAASEQGPGTARVSVGNEIPVVVRAESGQVATLATHFTAVAAVPGQPAGGTLWLIRNRFSGS